ncbi:Lens fiber membrane intrinsic protein [Liparis tanakae]|uniref:Lens fiber membrane intrinsic protein n=1 Tax=Liparis tanakae TaxID=230148 RepID=A0A4Z2EVS8_9TELE|nr:Lens fiber membrane intrinsic protein [Liparis tanakae]
MAIYTGVTVNFLGKRFGDWRFSWSYILGWVALLMNFFAEGLPRPPPGQISSKSIESAAFFLFFFVMLLFTQFTTE